MSAKYRQQLVGAIQRILASGPVSKDDMVTQLQQFGLTTELGTIYLVCSEHGLADLKGEMWTPRSWNPTSDSAQPVSESRAERAAAAKVSRMIAALGISASEPDSPAGPVPHEWSAIARSAVRGLQEEFNHTSKRKILSDVPLSGGFVTGQAGTRKLMRFEAEADLNVAEGTSATLIVEKQGYESEVVSIFGSVVTLSVPAETPRAAAGALRLDLSWLLREQCKRLQELVAGGPGFNAAAAMAVVAPDRDNFPRTPVRLTEDEVSDLNDGQRHAISLGLTHGVTWLWGPPGTGKTKTLSELVVQLAERGLRVLLSAPTNAALDVAVNKILEREPWLADGGLVRLGQPVDPTLVGREGGAVLVDEIAAERGAEIAQERVEAGRALAECRADLDDLRGKKRLTSAEEDHRSRLEQEIAEHMAYIKALNRGMMQVRRQVCRDAEVVAATAHQVVLETLRGQTFDVVVLDEASMTSAALAMLVAGSGSGHTVIAGDFRQLPPIAQATTAEVRDWLLQSPFERAGIDRAVADGLKPTGLAALTEQYRMRENIGSVVSEAFYPESPLITADLVFDRPRVDRPKWATGELVILDTSSLRPRTASRQGVYSRYNVAHLQLVAAMLGVSRVIESLALVTPFAPQARLLESLLPKDHGEKWAASTVHRFQGDERDVVVYDTVDTGYGIRGLHRWFTDGYAGSTGARLLNVAASRAKEHLVVIGALDSLHYPDTSEEAVWTFFAHLRDRANPLGWSNLVDGSSVTRLITTDLVQRMRADLSRAKTVDMWLPRAAPVNLPPLLAELKAVPRARDAESVTIWMEPDQDGHLPVEALQAKREGINIRPISPVLESFAIIGDVVWSASESLLGPRPGTVLRTEHGELAAAVRRIQRRRSDIVPGTGQLGQECGRCQRMLVRFETSLRGTPELRHECQACDRSAPRQRR